ncbi:radical SAM family heme chaperone HemW [Sungkyunkwania multivorans]|uniref:Heme chaperone HemW n=1 Tax=Sungkyunkwania multivorans TaxID=1173618 RepID=A0ABW3D1B7_9FLAO
MSGIYLHIPFCKQACHYCDFHFSTSLKKKDAMVEALQKELQLRKNEFAEEVIETIYFGGGTPSLLSIEDLQVLIDTVVDNYSVVESPEITLEANPDDLTAGLIEALANTKINRLSIGVQSFFETDLKLMNRAHNAKEAERCVEMASKHFKNISIDLIYGIPGMDNQRWIQNIQKALSYDIPHISSYALTVEPRTALAKFIQKGVVDPVDDDVAQEHFHLLVDRLLDHGYIHYELSNFGKKGYFSKNNTAYWKGKKYLGIGPSAHSFNGSQRSWNISSNSKYLKILEENALPLEIENLTRTDRYNEYVMTGLRTIWGVSLDKVKDDFGPTYHQYLLKQAQKYIEEHLLFIDKGTLLTSKKGKFLADGIASDLFLVNLT